MRVLITHSYFLHFDPKQFRNKTPYPPLATLYAAALLKEQGFEVKVADLQFSESPKEIEPHFENFNADVFVICDDGFNYLTKMCLSNMREAAFEMLQFARKKNIPAIISSSDASDHAALYFDKGADYVIAGEAEYTLLESLEALKKKMPLAEVPGLMYLQNGNIQKSAPRAVSKELDALPFPAWDLIDISVYKKTWKENHGYFSMNLVSTRGCPYKCNWCAKPIYGNRYNSHSPEYVIGMIRKLKKEFGAEHIWFADDIFGLKPGWLKEFSEKLVKQDFKIAYKIQSRADLLLEEENILRLASSGCETVWMGAESGSQKILDAMDKGITTTQIKNAVNGLKAQGIKAAMFLQFGYPGEELRDIRQTIELLKELKPDDIGVSVSYPLPGTKFYENVKSHLKEKSNWTDSDDLHLMFNNTYSPEFYRRLHRYVHHTFRAGQAKRYLGEFKISEYRRIALWPWYKMQGYKERKALRELEPNANGIL